MTAARIVVISSFVGTGSQSMLKCTYEGSNLWYLGYAGHEEIMPQKTSQITQ